MCVILQLPKFRKRHDSRGYFSHVPGVTVVSDVVYPSGDYLWSGFRTLLFNFYFHTVSRDAASFMDNDVWSCNVCWNNKLREETKVKESVSSGTHSSLSRWKIDFGLQSFRLDFDMIVAKLLCVREFPNMRCDIACLRRWSYEDPKLELWSEPYKSLKRLVEANRLELESTVSCKKKSQNHFVATRIM